MIKSPFLNEEYAVTEQIFGALNWQRDPQNLFDPIRYILHLGGKRIRPMLTLAGANLFEGDRHGKVRDWALAVELFHNFSLMHDDIMDEANLRRGYATVHKKYSINAAILSGDMALIESYRLLQHPDNDVAAQASKLFTKTAAEVCMGQQMDVDFETRDDVTISEYIQMIEWKTSVLLACSIQLGAMLANANESQQKHAYEFGKNIGIAFQIQDDILDTFGTTAKVGKRIGGDILQNKKTYLYLKSLALLDEVKAAQLRHLFSSIAEDEDEKIDMVTSLFDEANVRVYAEELKNEYKSLALSHLEAIAEANSNKKKELVDFADYLIQRDK